MYDAVDAPVLGPRAGLDDVDRRKFLPPPELKLGSFGRTVHSQSLCRPRYLPLLLDFDLKLSWKHILVYALFNETQLQIICTCMRRGTRGVTDFIATDCNIIANNRSKFVNNIFRKLVYAILYL
jgi:hypothetical protein